MSNWLTRLLGNDGAEPAAGEVVITYSSVLTYEVFEHGDGFGYRVCADGNAVHEELYDPDQQADYGVVATMTADRASEAGSRHINRLKNEIAQFGPIATVDEVPGE